MKYLVFGIIIGIIVAVLKSLMNCPKGKNANNVETNVISTDIGLHTEKTESSVKDIIQEINIPVKPNSDVIDIKSSFVFENNYFFKKPNGTIVYFNEDEILFANTLLSKLKENELYGSLELSLMANNLINFKYLHCQIGRIKLRGKIKMQTLTKNNVKWYEDITLKQALSYIDKWIDYAKSI